MSIRVVVALALVLAACSSGGEDDVGTGFLVDMYDHHEQAVRMALLVLADEDASPVTRAFATDTLALQRYEMGIMEGYLLASGETRGAPGREVMAWMDMPTPYDEMPGLATQAALDALASAGATDVDEQFFRLMIDHHEGGIHMADHAVEHASAQLVRDLAERIRTTQTLEIAEMEKAQEQLGIS